MDTTIDYLLLVADYSCWVRFKVDGPFLDLYLLVVQDWNGFILSVLCLNGKRHVLNRSQG